MVELIVTFLLIGMFMTAATTMLTSTLRFFTRMQSTSSAVNVSDMLLDKISGEISAATFPTGKIVNGYYFWLEPGAASTDGKSRWLVMQNRTGSPIAIFAAEADADGKAKTTTIDSQSVPGSSGKQLFMRYYENSTTVEAASRGVGSVKSVPQLDWHYDSRVYMDYVIDDLYFTRDDEENHPNVIKINLTMRNTRTGETYSTFRYAENYNNTDGGTYLCARSDGETKLPSAAGEFAFVKETVAPTEPEESETEDDTKAAGLHVIYVVLPDYDSVYAGTELKRYTEILKNSNPSWITPGHYDENGGFDFVYGHIHRENPDSDQQAEEDTDKAYTTVELRQGKSITLTYYYKPREVTYCRTKNLYGNGDSSWFFKNYDSVEYYKGLHGQIVTKEAPIQSITMLDSNGLRKKYDLVDDGGNVVQPYEITKTLVYKNDYNGNAIGSPNNFRFFYKQYEGEYEYKIKGLIEESSRKLTDNKGTVWGTGSTEEKTLYEENHMISYDDMISGNKYFDVKAYDNLTTRYQRYRVRPYDNNLSDDWDAYVVGANVDGDVPEKEIEYKPADVTLTLYGKYENNVLYERTLIVHYGETLKLKPPYPGMLNLTNYSSPDQDKEVTIVVDSLDPITYTWRYWASTGNYGDAPYRPVGSEVEVTISSNNVSEKFKRDQLQIGEELRDFFATGWTTSGVGSSSSQKNAVTYKKYTALDGVTHAVAGYGSLNIKYSSNVDGVLSKNVTSLYSSNTGTTKYLTINSGNSFVQYILSMAGVDLNSISGDLKFEFVDKLIGVANRNSLNSVTYTANGIQVKLTFE